jgi:hypothetical protein
MIRWIKCKLFHNFKDSKVISKKQIDGVSAHDDFVYTETIRECKCGRTFNDNGLNFRDGLTISAWLNSED